jgi:hypothetical protein
MRPCSLVDGIPSFRRNILAHLHCQSSHFFLLHRPRLEPRLGHVRFCGGQCGTGVSFLRVLRFPLPILIPPTVHTHHVSSGAGTIGQLVADVPSGLPHPTQKTTLTLLRPHAGTCLWSQLSQTAVYFCFPGHSVEVLCHIFVFTFLPVTQYVRQEISSRARWSLTDVGVTPPLRIVSRVQCAEHTNVIRGLWPDLCL